MKLFQQAEILHGVFQLCLHSCRGGDQRQTAFTGLPAQAVHGPLDRDGVYIGKQRLDERQGFQLHGQAPGGVTCKPLGADVVGVLGRDVGQHADDALAAQCQQRHNLVIVPE